jgi:MoaE-MoaD fusion protein
MRVHVLFFGILKEMAGRSADDIDLGPGASVRDVVAYYEPRIPHWTRSAAAIAMAVNQRYAGPETELQEGDEVALLPPVSGGASEVSAQARHARLTRRVIETKKIVEDLKGGEDGASLVFEGIVRNQTRGRKTLHLDYEAYEEMAVEQMESLATEALGKFQIRDVALVHRLGRLEVGETSVLIAVVSAHRAASFEACRWLIDRLKKTVPIWKKESFEDGALWADGEPFPDEIPRPNS